jgi:hypothetical protein
MLLKTRRKQVFTYLFKYLFMVNLTMLPITPDDSKIRPSEQRVTKDVEGSNRSLEGLKKTTRNLCEDSRSPGQNLNYVILC